MRFGRLSTTKELYGIIQKPEGTGRSVKYVVYFSIFICQSFVSTNSTTLPGKPSNKRRWREMLDEDGDEVGRQKYTTKQSNERKV